MLEYGHYGINLCSYCPPRISEVSGRQPLRGCAWRRDHLPRCVMREMVCSESEAQIYKKEIAEEATAAQNQKKQNQKDQTEKPK